MIKIDLHTHSEASPDGGITLTQYKKALKNGLDYIAITDHNRIDFALYAKQEIGKSIIVGEEIMTTSGEIIGLFLKEKVPMGLSPKETVKRIKEQNGLVYIPHPFEVVRSGMNNVKLKSIIKYVDIIETYNGRAFFGKKTNEVIKFAEEYKVVSVASSDTHGWKGWRETYTIIKEPPTRDNLVYQLLESKKVYKKPSIRAILYPKYNKIKKALS